MGYRQDSRVAPAVPRRERYHGYSLFLEPDRNHVGKHASILFAPSMLRPLVYALFIVLHNYPSKPVVKRYDTTFRSLAESFEQDEPPPRTQGGETQ